MFYFYLFSFLWFLRETRMLLFWLYLWQLKEYHWGRFLDHFRTEKGKKLFLHPFFIFKAILFFYGLSLALPFKFFYTPFLTEYLNRLLLFLLLFIYFIESLKGLKEVFQKIIKKPILTLKTSLLVLMVFFLEIAFLFFLFQKFYFDFFIYGNIYWLVFWLLLFDLLTPLIATCLVFLVHPFSVIFFRNPLIQKAKEKRASFKDLIVIGITGSYGKTSTKEFLAEILSQKYQVLKTKEHQNSEAGISQCILNDLKPEHEVFVVEMGAYNKGGIKLLCDIAKPKIGILTGVNAQHLATFGSMENLISAEGGKELIGSLPQDGLMIFNGANPFCQKIYQETKLNKKIISPNFSTIAKKLISPDCWAENIRVEREYLSFEVISKDGERADFLVNLLGVQNIENILLATSCAKELGMNLKEISEACQKLKPLPHQMELKKGINGLNIIDATYSVNLDGVISHLEYLKIWPGKKIIVMPCLIELGRVSREVHRRIGKKIAKICDLAIITTKDKFKEIKEGAGEKVIFLEDPKKIFEKIKNFCRPNDVILLEGRLPKKLFTLLTQ